MKRILRGAALLAATSSLLPSAVHAHRTLELDLYRRENNALERRGTVGNTLYGLLTWGYYYVNITVGTPPQEQVVIFDTGSSDLYFNKAGSSFCDSSVSECVGGTFDPSQSSTWKDLDLPYMTGYGDPDVPDGIISVNGTYGTDTIGFANLQIPNVQFGLADQDNATGLQQGLVGMSYPYNEAARTEYPTFLQVLVDAGVIPSRLFSTYLNWVQPVSGSVLFGGIDTSKYEGQLTTINLFGSMGPVVTDFTVAITDITTSSSGNTSNVDLGLHDTPSQPGLTGIFDTGTPYLIVSTAAYHGIRSAFPYLDSQDNCSCSHRYDDVEVSITFNSAATIKVPGSALILPLYDETGKPLPYSGSGGGDLCTFVVQPQNTLNELIFGAPVLTAMYVVFDLDNGLVSVAQAASNSTAAPNIVEVPAGSDGVAGVSASLVSYTNAAQPTSQLSLSVNGSAPTTVSYSAKTMASTMGLLTGVAAEPTAARLEQSASHGAAARTTAVIGGPLSILGNLGVWTGCAIGAVAAIGMIAL